MKIYRVENRDGEGPYQCGDRSPWWLDKRESTEHPEPNYIFLLENPEWFCGFDSPEQLFAWFTCDELERLKKEGFLVHIFEVPEADKDDLVRADNRQVLFRRLKLAPIAVID